MPRRSRPASCSGGPPKVARCKQAGHYPRRRLFPETHRRGLVWPCPTIHRNSYVRNGSKAAISVPPAGLVESAGAASYLPVMPTTELRTDAALGVTIPARDARGRIARLGPVVDAVLANHGYPPLIERLLAEALTLTALLGSLLKEPQGQMTLQAQTRGGIVDLMVCDFLGGELRGYIRHDA